MLADTKYEFGLAPDGALLLIDEVHTPDSSRFWAVESLEERLAQGTSPESFDKEPVRLALGATGYKGDGEPPDLPDEVWDAASQRYVDLYESPDRVGLRTRHPASRGSHPPEPGGRTARTGVLMSAGEVVILCGSPSDADWVAKIQRTSGLPERDKRLARRIGPPGPGTRVGACSITTTPVTRRPCSSPSPA